MTQPVFLNAVRHFARRRNAPAVLLALWFATATGCSWLGGGSGKIADVSDPAALGAAVDAAREQARLSPNEPYWPFHIAELYVSVDSLDRAQSHLLRALEVDPTYAPAATLLSRIYFDRSVHNQAVVMLEAMLVAHPDSPDAIRVALALHLEAIDDPVRAQALLAECAGDSPEAIQARTYVGLRGDDPRVAIEPARRAVADNPQSAASHNNYGIALLHAGRPVEARKAFLDALKINSTLPGAMYNMAIVEAFYFFDEDAGRRWFEQYLQFATDDPDDLATQLRIDVTAMPRTGDRSR